jgi:hypothetical protein
MKLAIRQDIDVISPRDIDYNSNLGTIAHWHRRYDLGDSIDDLDDFIIELLDIEEAALMKYHKWSYNNRYDMQSLRYNLLEKLSKKYIWLPVYMFDHSGVALNTTGFSCPWDSGQVGIIYASKEEIAQEFGVKRFTKKKVAQFNSYLEAELEVYSQYLNGDIYGYELTDDDGDIVDSCYGFYGSDWSKNGMKDYIPAEHLHLLEGAEMVYD